MGLCVALVFPSVMPNLVDIDWPWRCESWYIE